MNKITGANVKKAASHGASSEILSQDVIPRAGFLNHGFSITQVPMRSPS
jgi:hypothetical protein